MTGSRRQGSAVGQGVTAVALSSVLETGVLEVVTAESETLVDGHVVRGSALLDQSSARNFLDTVVAGPAGGKRYSLRSVVARKTGSVGLGGNVERQGRGTTAELLGVAGTSHGSLTSLGSRSTVGENGTTVALGSVLETSQREVERVAVSETSLDCHALTGGSSSGESSAVGALEDV